MIEIKKRTIGKYYVFLPPVVAVVGKGAFIVSSRQNVLTTKGNKLTAKKGIEVADGKGLLK
jgi:hypothetical protein